MDLNLGDVDRSFDVLRVETRTFVPGMKARGYDPYSAGAITAAPFMIGPIIPPVIIYGGLTVASVAALLIAGGGRCKR